MKVSEFISIEEVKSEIDEERKADLAGIVKSQIKTIRDAEKTLAQLKKAHKDFLAKDISEIEESGMVW